MARTFTRGQLRTRLEQLTDTENDAHLGTSEKNAILNSAIAETWDCICNAGLGEKYVTSVTFNTTAGTLEYPFSTVVSAGDFYRVHQLYVVENSTQLRALQRVNPGEITAFKAPQSVVPMKLYYLPCAPTIADGSDSTTFDGINGWEEHTLMTAACAVKLKKEDDYNVFFRRKKELEGRIQSMGQVDFGEPIRVTRKYRRRNDPWCIYQNNVNAYGIRGDKLELYYLSGLPYAG